MRLYKHVSLASFSIRSNKPSGAFGVLTITMYGFDFAMYLSDTSLASCCCPGGKKSASSNNMNEIEGKIHDSTGNALSGILVVARDRSILDTTFGQDTSDNNGA